MDNNIKYEYLILTHKELLLLYKNNKNFVIFMDNYYKEYLSKIRKSDIQILLKYDKKDYITYNNDYYCILCKDKNNYIGITFLIKNLKNIKIFETLPKKYINYWYIYGTYIEPSYRKKGINMNLLKYFMKKYKINKLMCLIDKNNINSINSYNKIGFKINKYKTPYFNTNWHILN